MFRHKLPGTKPQVCTSGVWGIMKCGLKKKNKTRKPLKEKHKKLVNIVLRAAGVAAMSII